MKQRWFNVGISVMVAALLVAGLYTFNAMNQPEARGSQNFGSVTLGGAITDIERVRGVMRTYDGSDYYENVVASDVPGSANNGWQAAYNVTDWDGETAMTAMMAQVMVTAVTTQSEAYGADFMSRYYGVVGTGTATGIGMFAEVIAVNTSTIPYGYAVYGQLETSGTGDNSITDGSVFYADLAGAAQDYGTVDVLSVKSGDTYDYGIDFSGATAMTADFRFQNGTELEEATDTVLTFSEFLAAEEQTVVVVGAGGTITPTGTYQPITSTAAVTTSLTTAIADGVVNGQLLILVNENASDVIIIDDGANTHLSGNISLGNDDTLTVFWDGEDWLEIAQGNNS